MFYIHFVFLIVRNLGVFQKRYSQMKDNLPRICYACKDSVARILLATIARRTIYKKWEFLIQC